MAGAAEALCAQLSGRWGGSSVSLRGDVRAPRRLLARVPAPAAHPPPTRAARQRTEWRDTALQFHYDPARPGVAAIRGVGTSLWRGHSIEFRLSGTVDLTSRVVSMTKAHVGRFTNVVEYTASLDEATKHIGGSYSGGSIELSFQSRACGGAVDRGGDRCPPHRIAAPRSPQRPSRHRPC